MPESLDALLATRAAAEPNRPILALAERPIPVTLGEFHKAAGAAAAFLAARGIGPGDRVALWGQNSAEWAIWLAAAARRGAALVALHPALEAAELESALEQSRPAWLIVDEMARGRSLADLARPLTDRLTVMPGGDGVLDLPIDLAAEPPPPLGRPEAVLNIQFTSGSTGRPKAVLLSNRALILNARLTAEAAGIGADDRLACDLPLTHAAGLSSGLILALETGALWCSSHRFRPDVALAQIERHRCTVLQAVPTMLKAVTDLALDTPSLRLGFIGGAPCPPELARRAVEKLGLERLAIIYGQTEFGPTIAIGDDPAKLVVLPGSEIRIADNEIWVRGPTLMDGYFDDPQATAAAVTADGWLKTGDLGRLEEEHLALGARLKELIIRGGENVSPQEIEELLRGLPGVVDACVVPAPSDHWGEEICAVIVGPADFGALRDGCAAQLARFKRPDRFLRREQFPTLPSGKVNRRAVREAVARGEWT